MLNNNVEILEGETGTMGARSSEGEAAGGEAVNRTCSGAGTALGGGWGDKEHRPPRAGPENRLAQG